MADQQFCLRWNNHQSTLISVFDTLLENGTLVDCTLAAEGQYLKAHKVVLSACSPYLETLLSQHYEKHPIVILKDVKFTELKSMMDYMYRGEVNISQDQLGTFLKAAESLQIKGLSDNGADGDARDVGSTPKAPPPPRKAAQPAPSIRPSLEPQRPDSPRSRDGSISPSSRKRRRIRRNSQGDDGTSDNHLDTSNTCDLPSQAQSTPIVSNIPSSVSSSITTTPIIKPPIVKPEQTDSLVNRIDTSNLNSLPPESGLLKEKIEPISEPLLEPKTEYLEDMNNDDSVEDLTLDDDDDMEGMDVSNMSNLSNLSNMSRPGPSHGNDVSNQGFAPWHLGGNQSGATDEVFMAAQEAVGAHRESQDMKLQKMKELQEKKKLQEIKELKDIKELQDLKEETEEDTEESQDTEEEVEEYEVAEIVGDSDYVLCYMCSGCGKNFEDNYSSQFHVCSGDQASQPEGLRTEEVLPENEDAEGVKNEEHEYSGKEDKEFFIPLSNQPNVLVENVFLTEEIIPMEESGEGSTSPIAVRKRPFLCRGCNTIFPSNDDLIRHPCLPRPKTDVFSAEKLGVGPYLCPGCGVVVRHKKSYIRHVQVYCGKERRPELGKPPYLCNTCGKVYKHKSTFSRHIHHQCNRPPQFSCTVCPKMFTSKFSMKKHFSKAHKLCPICKAQFPNKMEYDFHVKNNHDNSQYLLGL